MAISEQTFTFTEFLVSPVASHMDRKCAEGGGGEFNMGLGLLGFLCVFPATFT